MSGLLALLDDVAAIAKVAAASLDDVTAQAMKATSKAAGVVIDDAAVTPKYVTGLEPARELPIIWKITKASIFNKLIVLLPAALLLSTFVPWIIIPLLMLGGAYLSYEGAEKVVHWIAPHADKIVEEDLDPKDPVRLEKERVQGAIKTDFILSAEIMTIILNEIPDGSIWIKAGALGLAGLTITVAVYGVVAMIVKMDDIGLKLSIDARFEATRAFGRLLVRGMPHLLVVLSVVGTVAMLWVGGSIEVHGLETLGFGWPGHTIHDIAHLVSHAVPEGLTPTVNWLTSAVFYGLFGLALGLVLIPLVSFVTRLRGKDADTAH